LSRACDRRHAYRDGRKCLTSEAVQGASLPLEGVDDIHGSHSLAASVLGVGDGVTNNVLEEDLEDTAGLLVDQTRDTLDTTTASQTADGGLGDTLDVVTQHLTVALGSTLSESFSCGVEEEREGGGERRLRRDE